MNCTTLSFARSSWEPHSSTFFLKSYGFIFLSWLSAIPFISGYEFVSFHEVLSCHFSLGGDKEKQSDILEFSVALFKVQYLDSIESYMTNKKQHILKFDI